MIIMGIDPGTTRMGWGLICYEDGVLRSHTSGIIRPPTKRHVSERLWIIFQELDALVEQHTPDIMAVETPFVGRYPGAGLVIGQAQAVVMLIAKKHLCRLEYFSPTAVKKGVADYGHAGKGQVAAMVKGILHTGEKLLVDQSDALAVAICQANQLDGAAVMARSTPM